jgi:hypothetical protein
MIPMMSIEYIHQLSEEAGAIARHEKRQPLWLWHGQNFAERIRRIPFLGTYCHPKWRRVNIRQEFGLDERYLRGLHDGDNADHGAWFVDSSGWGGDDEPALSYQTFVKLLKPGYGYGIVEQGQFQLKVGLFARV